MSSVIDKYLEAIREVTSASGEYAYRGQADSAWPLHSSATRRLLKEARNDGEKKQAILQDQGFTIDYHRELIDRARTGGFGIEDGREVTDLQLLAKLQHFRAATGLLDFTWSPIVALWFAVKNDTKNDDKDGAIFIVNTNAPFYVKQILDKPALDLSNILSNIFSDDFRQPNLAYLEPTLSGDAKSRILSQRSLFIIGRPSTLEDSEIIRPVVIHRHVGTPIAAARRGFEIIKIFIKQEYKKELRKDLEHLDFDESSLFRGDIYGFAQVESFESPLPQESDTNHYLIQGNTSLQQGEYDKAIEYYDQAIDQDKGLFQAYYNRGVAKSELDQHESAIADYDEAIRLRSDFAEAYINRGAAKHKLDRYDSAIADYGEAIRLKPDDALAYYNRGVARSSLGKHKKAIADFDKAIQLKPDYVLAYYNRGVEKNELGWYESAIADYDEAIRLKPDDAEAYFNRGGANWYLMGHKEDARRDLEQAHSLAQKQAGKEDLMARIESELKNFAAGNSPFP